PEIAEKWAKTSAPPSSGLMKPKPFSALNHFTVPVVMVSPSGSAARLAGAAATVFVRQTLERERRPFHEDRAPEKTSMHCNFGNNPTRSAAAARALVVTTTFLRCVRRMVPSEDSILTN